MNGAELQERAQERAEELPLSVLEHPFGPGWEVYTVRDKVFMLLTELSGVPIVILKSDPEDSEALRAQRDDITTGYHMNKRHWITLHPSKGMARHLVNELVTESYRLVVAKLPAAKRPVDPATFAHH